MKKCTIGLLTKLIAFLVMIGFFLPLTLLFLWLFLHDTQAAPSLQQTYLLGVLLFGSFLLFAAYRTLYLGLIWVEYNEETVIFHYSRSEEYTFRWEDIPGKAIQAGVNGRGYIFCIEGDFKDRQIPLNHASKGFRDFEKMLEAKGVIRMIGVLSKEDYCAAYKKMWEGMGKKP